MRYPDVGNADSSEDLGQPGRNLHEAEGQTSQPLSFLLCYHLCSMSGPGCPVSLGIVADPRMFEVQQESFQINGFETMKVQFTSDL